MSLFVDDFKGEYNVATIDELDRVLKKRYGADVNGFWISRTRKSFPTISLLVKGSLSTLLYMPNDGHPGFAPVGREQGLDGDECTTFSIETVEQEQDVLNSQVVSISKAMDVAREFFLSQELPKSIEWQEL